MASSKPWHSTAQHTHEDSIFVKTFGLDCVAVDCERAEPVIYKLVNEIEKPVTLIRIYVGDRPTWRTPDNPMRCDERFKLKGVPTLIRWENGGVAGRLEDYEAHNEIKVKKLLSDTKPVDPLPVEA